MVQTNCELPKSLIERNLELNDMDLVLFHLYDSYEWYRDYYKNLRKTHPNRTMILDNSEYEYFIKGLELDLNKYYKVINDLKPDYYILPDVLMDREKTLEKVDEFLKHYIIDASKPMGVIQGNSPKDFEKCMKDMMERGINDIAIPFHNSFFKEMIIIGLVRGFFDYKYEDRCKEDVSYAKGRVQWMLDNREELEKFNYVHVLGSHCPYEKFFYTNIATSMDTGYPVKCGIEGYRLFEEPHKPNIIIDDFLENELDESTKKLIIENIDIFKNIGKH